PATIDEGLTTTARVVTFANFAGTMIVFTAGIRVVLEWYRVGALRWVGAGVGCFVLGGATYAAPVKQSVTAGGPSHGLFLIFLLCWGAAALTPSMAAARS